MSIYSTPQNNVLSDHIAISDEAGSITCTLSVLDKLDTTHII